MKKTIMLILTLSTLLNLSAKQSKYEWDKYSIPAKADNGYKWVLQEAQSDDFNYEHSFDKKNPKFYEKWKDFYIGNWSGPKPTVWKHDHIFVKDGNLKIIATRKHNQTCKIDNASLITLDHVKNKTPKQIEVPITNMGCISSIAELKYPIYIEAYAKMTNNVLASNVWMLSSDATQEIDIHEGYASERKLDKTGKVSDKIHISHHVFIRKPFQDYQPHDKASWQYSKAGKPWKENYHRLGVHWKNPLELDYYLDGELVRSIKGMDIIDPKGYTDGTGLNKAMKIIINMEDQTWRALAGLSPTAEEIKDVDNHTFFVDWIRVYKPVKK